MTHRLGRSPLLLAALLLAAACSGEGTEGACVRNGDCPEGEVCGSDGQCAPGTTYRPPRPIGDPTVVPDAGVSLSDAGSPTDGGARVDGGTGTSARPADLVPSGNPEWTIILDRSTWVLTEFSEFMTQPDSGACFFIGYNLDRARSEGPVSGGDDGPARGHSGWSQWYGTGNYGYDPRCSETYAAEFTLGTQTYSLTGTLVKAISVQASGSGGPSVTGTWSDGARSGEFELYDYVR